MAELPSSHSTTNYSNCKMHLSILFIFIAVFVYGADARPLTQESRANNQVILSYTTDTHSRHETGVPGRAVQGFYSYIGGDGRWYKVTYQADERGYRAKTEQLPLPLPIDKPVVNPPTVQVSNNIVEVTPVAQVIETGTPKNEALAVVQEVETPQEVIETEETIVSNENNVLKEQQPPPPVLSNNEPAVAIHVPLFTKVYTLKKGNTDPKRRKTKNGSSQIYRYKLAYLPSYGLW